MQLFPLTNTDPTIQANADSPSASSFVDVSKMGQNNGLFGMSAGDITSGFGSAYSKATAGYAPFPGAPVQKSIAQLQGVYNGIPGAYDVSGTVNAMNAARQSALLTGQQASNTAAQSYTNAQQPGQYTGAGASVLRAQALLPFLNADTSAAADVGKYTDTAKQAASSASASIATQLAQLQQQYTNSLASYNSSKATFGLNYADQQQGLALQANSNQTQNAFDLYKTQAQLAENARQANLAALLQQRGQNLNYDTSATQAQLQAMQLLAQQKGPTGAWTTDAQGHITSGQDSYNAYQQYQENKPTVQSILPQLNMGGLGG